MQNYPSVSSNICSLISNDCLSDIHPIFMWHVTYCFKKILFECLVTHDQKQQEIITFSVSFIVASQYFQYTILSKHINCSHMTLLCNWFSSILGNVLSLEISVCYLVSLYCVPLHGCPDKTCSQL